MIETELLVLIVIGLIIVCQLKKQSEAAGFKVTFGKPRPKQPRN